MNNDIYWKKKSMYFFFLYQTPIHFYNISNDWLHTMKRFIHWKCTFAYKNFIINVQINYSFKFYHSYWEFIYNCNNDKLSTPLHNNDEGNHFHVAVLLNVIKIKTMLNSVFCWFCMSIWFEKKMWQKHRKLCLYN